MIKKQDQTMTKMISLSIGLVFGTLALLFTLGFDELASSFNWGGDNASKEHGIRREAQAAVGARVTEMRAARDECMERTRPNERW